MKVSIIGSGNVAWHLAPALDSAGHQVQEVYSRQLKNAKVLCSKLYNATPVTDLDFSASKAELFLICVPDDAISEVLQQLIVPPTARIAHTSGSIPMSVFEPYAFTHFGVFYPVQTFSKAKPISLKNVPICIEATDAETEKILEKVAFAITETVCFIDSTDRQIVHVAAVLACNFTNHLMTISEQLLTSNGLQFEIIKPLIAETLQKSLQLGPMQSQTGPAVRGDFHTLQRHEVLLQSNPALQHLYKVLTESILKTHHVQ